MPKKMKGKGITDTIRNIFNKASSVNKTLKDKRYAGRLIWAVPEIENVPYIGAALKTAAKYGYGQKIRGRGMGNKILYNTPNGLSY